MIGHGDGVLARARRVLAGALLAALLLVGVLASDASAAAQRGYVFNEAASFGSEGSGSGQLRDPAGVAVSQESGDVYVVDAGNNRIDVFEASGKFLEAWGFGVKNGAKELQKCTKECRAGLAGHGKGQLHGAEAIAVDNNPASAAYGSIYVEAVTPYEETETEKGEFEYGVIDRFNAKGEVLEAIKDYKEHGSSPEKFEEPHGLTVNPAGNLVVYNEEDAIEFSDTVKNGEVQTNFALKVETEQPNEARPGIAADAEKHLYFGHAKGVAETSATVFGKDVIVEEEGETFSLPLFQQLDGEESTGITVDPNTQDALIDNATSVALFAPTGLLIDRFGGAEGPGGADVLDHGTGITTRTDAGEKGFSEVLVADAGTGRIDVFSPEPAGAPRIDEVRAANSTDSTTELEGAIDPHGLTTSYFFRYSAGAVPTASEPCTGACFEAPVPAATIGASGQYGDLSLPPQPITNLVPGTVYHFRLFASNSAGSAESTERSVSIGGETLPDHRAWALVSPIDKNGGFLEGIPREGGLIEAAADGSGITYVSTAATNGAQGNRSPEYDQLLSTRSTNGEGEQEWSTTTITTPVDKAEGFRNANNEYQWFSPDLSVGLVKPYGGEAFESPPLSEEATETTVYQRHNLTCATDPKACYTPLVDGANVTGEENGKKSEFGSGLRYVASNSSGAQSVVYAGVPLTSEPAAAGYNLYETSEGKLQLVNVLPDNAPAPEATLAYRNKQVRNAISAQASPEAGGSRVIFSAGGSLYMREMGARKTLRVDTAVGVAQPEGAQATFQMADREDSTIFFTDPQKLTVGSTATLGDPDLYVCEVVQSEGAPACELSDLTVDHNAGEAADVLGLTPGADEEAGSNVYFVANGVLAEHASGGECGAVSEAGEQLGATCNLYVASRESKGHWGAPKLIAVLSAEDESDWQTLGNDLGHITSRSSPDGRWFAFMSDQELTGYNTHDVHSGRQDEEVYLYDAANGSLVCASCDPSGERPVGVEDTEVSGEGIGLLVDRPLTWEGRWLAANVPGWTPLNIERALYQSRYLSNNGRLFFNSAQNLVSQDHNHTQDVYEFEPDGIEGPAHEQDCTSATHNADVVYSESAGGCIAMISSGSSEGKESAFLDASEEGTDVFFDTTAHLSTLDEDSNFDIYDAGICGVEGAPGCVPQPVPPPPPCADLESCRGSGPSNPTLGGGSSGTLTPSASANSSAVEVLGSKTTVAAKPAKKPTRAQLYAKAIKQCRKLHKKSKRQACERTARKKYGPIAKHSRKNSHVSSKAHR